MKLITHYTNRVKHLMATNNVTLMEVTGL